MLSPISKANQIIVAQYQQEGCIECPVLALLLACLVRNCPGRWWGLGVLAPSRWDRWVHTVAEPVVPKLHRWQNLGPLGIKTRHLWIAPWT